MKIRTLTTALFLLIVLQVSLPILCAAQNPLTALADVAKEKAAEAAIETLLNNQLPLTLNAKDVYPTVTTLPGGPFNPTPLHLTADRLSQPLAPGDYTINTLDFCSEYSVHEPGAGVAYVLGPYEGKAASAIGALIWRGTVQYGINPNSLQAVSWTIQSGLTYSQMPKSYQAIVDQVIPDFKSEIASDFIVNLETTYNNAAKTAQLPPLDTLLGKMGTSGQLALDAERQRAILTSQNTSDQLKEQTLFQGQESGIYTPVKAETGPWTERVKGQVYMKLLIAGGNMNTNNVMQIRIMPPTTANARNAGPNPRLAPRLVLAKYGEPQTAPPGEGSGTSVTSMMQGSLGYSQGRGAQALGQVPVVAPSAPVQGPPAPPPPVQAGTVKSVHGMYTDDGDANVQRAGTHTWTKLKDGDPLYVGDILQTTHSSETNIVMEDGTKWTLGEDTEWDVQSYQAPSVSQLWAKYQGFTGTYLFLHDLISNEPPGIQVMGCEVYGGDNYGCGSIGIRGTEFIWKVDSTAKTMEIDLISGAVAVTPAGSTTAGPTINAPMQIEVTPQGVTTLPLTQDQYNAIKAQNFPAPVPTS